MEGVGDGLEKVERVGGGPGGVVGGPMEVTRFAIP